MLVKYTALHWEVLEIKRGKALSLMRTLHLFHIPSYVYGSVARGDVKKNSDVDVFVPWPSRVLEIEEALRGSTHVYSRMIVQATPAHAPKGYIILNPEETEVISFPIAPLMPREEEFYRFGGLIGLKELEAGKRVPGVNKKLILIVPNRQGHEELSVKNNEFRVASVLNIPVETVAERVRILSRRQRIGRTGVFLKHYLQPNQTFEEAILELSRENKFFSKLMRKRGVL